MKKASQSQISTPAPAANKALRWGLTYGLLLVGYVGAALLLSLLTGPVLSLGEPWLLVLVVLFVVFTFEPAHTRLRAAVDRALAGRRAAHDSLLRSYRRRLATAVDVSDVASALVEHAEAGVPGATADLYLPDGRLSSYSSHVNGEKPVLAGDSPLVISLQKASGALHLAEEDWPDELRPHGDAVQALDAAVIVPIAADGLLGWVTLGGNEDGRRFDQGELNYLEALAEQSVPALERVNLIRRLEARVAELNMLSRFSQALNHTIESDVDYADRTASALDRWLANHELQARAQQLETINEITRSMTATVDLEQVVNITLDWALRLCQGTTGALVLIDTEGRPRIHAARGYDGSFDPGAAPTDALEAGLVGQVLSDGRPHVTGDVHQHENYISAASDTRSQLAVPITFQQKTIGAIAIEKDVQNAFGDEDVERAVRLANHAGAAIANALLHRQVTAANEAKSEFVSMVSHELKTPLTAIRGYADLMLGGMTGDVNERQRKFLQTIGRNIEKTNRLIRDLTDISRIETGKLHVEPAPISFATVVSESVQTVGGMYDEKEMALHVDLPADLPPVLGDHHRLVQALTNLLSNACKYSPAGADVYITVCDEVADEVHRPPEAVVYCAVRDTGYGISQADQAKLFTKFFRSANPDVQAAPGTGLGLSIARGIVELHGGKIWFDSVLGEGTVFYFTVPQVA